MVGRDPIGLQGGGRFLDGATRQGIPKMPVQVRRETLLKAKSLIVFIWSQLLSLAEGLVSGSDYRQAEMTE